MGSSLDAEGSSQMILQYEQCAGFQKFLFICMECMDHKLKFDAKKWAQYWFWKFQFFIFWLSKSNYKVPLMFSLENIRHFNFLPKDVSVISRFWGPAYCSYCKHYKTALDFLSK